MLGNLSDMSQSSESVTSNEERNDSNSNFSIKLTK